MTPRDNLVRSGGLKAEAADQRECKGLLRSAIERLTDAGSTGLSFFTRLDH